MINFANNNSNIQIYEESKTSIEIFPFKNLASKIELQENSIRLALKSAFQPQQTGSQEEFNFLYVASAHVDDINNLSFIIEQFDKGLKKQNGSFKSLVPSSQVPNAIYIPSRLISQSNLTLEAEPDVGSYSDLSLSFYINSMKLLESYLTSMCPTVDAIQKAAVLCSNLFYSNNLSTIVSVTFDLITVANNFLARRIQPIPIIETSLLKILTTTSSFYLKPKTGFCALYKRENLLLLMDSEPKIHKMLLTGIWVSGTQSVDHPITWSACLRYVFSNCAMNKANSSSFFVILFPSLSKRPEFYICESTKTSLDFTLLTGFKNIIINKLDNENRYFAVDLLELRNSYQFQLFTKGQNQLVYSQNVFRQHQTLESSTSHSAMKNFSQLSIKNELSQSIENELLPRCLSANLLTDQMKNYEKMISSCPVNFFKPDNEEYCKKASEANPIGSYHSVSDISVLSDNELDEQSSFFTNSLNSSSSNHFIKQKCSMRATITSNNIEPEFLRPKEPPIPIMSNFNASSTRRIDMLKYNAYNSSLSSSGSISSLSPSPSPTFNTQPRPNVTAKQSNNASLDSSHVPSLNQQSSKSMLFGIPRTSPMPAIPSAPVDFNAHTLDSPFVDMSLNNCEPQVVAPFQSSQGHQLDASEQRKPILKKLPTLDALETANEEKKHVNYMNSMTINRSAESVEEHSNYSSKSKKNEMRHEMPISTEVLDTNEIYGVKKNNLKQQPVFNRDAVHQSNVQLSINSSSLSSSSSSTNNSQLSSSSGFYNYSNITTANNNNNNNCDLNHSKQKQLNANHYVRTHDAGGDKTANSVNLLPAQQLNDTDKHAHLFNTVYNTERLLPACTIAKKIEGDSIKNLPQFQYKDSQKEVETFYQQAFQKPELNHHPNIQAPFQNLITETKFSSKNTQPAYLENEQKEKKLVLSDRFKEDDEANEESDDEECENYDNVFSEALKNLKQKISWHQQNSQIDPNQSNYLSQVLEFAAVEPTQKGTKGVEGAVWQKLNYVSLLLDDFCDKNTSLNTKALALKYLKDANFTTNNNNNNTSNCESFMSSYTPCVDNPFFQYYEGGAEENCEQSGYSILKRNYLKSSKENVSKGANIISCNQFNNKESTSKFLVKDKKFKPIEKDSYDKDDNEDDGNEEDEEEEIWVFKKPDLTSKSANLKQQKESEKCSAKFKLRLQRQEKRGTRQKNFSDEDEDPDRDVTTILDIAKLKRLPKLL